MRAFWQCTIIGCLVAGLALAPGAFAAKATSPSRAASQAQSKSTLVEASWKAYKAGDYKAAINGFKHLARDGVVKAQTNLGYMYAVGKGVPVDLAESAAWFRMAAERGHSGAQSTLGLYYFHGEGVEKDLIAAHAWFTLAASAGHRESEDYQALVEQNMKPDDLAKAHALAKKLYAQFGESKNLW